MPHNTYYNDYGLTNVPKDFKNNQEINNLFKIPKKEKGKEMPKFYNFTEDYTHQTDILYMPNDNGFKYCLVVVDVATNKCDAEPLKEISSKTVYDAIMKIYKRKILNVPHKLITDAGPEFKGSFKNSLNNDGISLKNAIAGRHRQIGMVEKKNQIIGKTLMMKMFAREMLTGETNRQWVKDLPNIINRMNNKYYHDPINYQESIKNSPFRTLKQEMIPLGSIVRVKLDEPRDIAENKLHGKFRSGDHRWSIEKYKVVNYIIDPLEPVLYIINKKLKPGEHVAYTAKQLQVVSPNEEEPPGDIALNGMKPNQYVISKVKDFRKNGKTNQFLIQWKGYPKKINWTWENQRDLPKTVIDEYLNSLI